MKLYLILELYQVSLRCTYKNQIAIKCAAYQKIQSLLETLLGKIFKIPSFQRNIRWYLNIQSMLSELKIVLMENKISMEFAECLLTISKESLPERRTWDGTNDGQG
ncbi:hypothetical protein CEXT_121261 [Caerostris extrusa]|uniref:Uncharacterized protein n=1 Tax=Caerostris extrusa TaxID=172846 RepID=A0AAV4P7H0_CAEEX|nr:hypothetical protein CEXT_121261 [Caerostris extrusa]